MTHTESTLRLQVAGQLMGSAQDGQRVRVHGPTLEAYRLEQGKARHEPLWLEVDARRGSRVVKVQVELTA